jgi:hypothetical protein
MSSVFVVIVDVFRHQPFQMRLVEHDDMIEQVSAAAANPALGEPVLPRTAKAGSLRLDAEALHCVYDFVIEVGCTIEDQVSAFTSIRTRAFARAPRKACPAQRALVGDVVPSEQQAAGVKPGFPEASLRENTNYKKSDRRKVSAIGA